MANVEKVLDAFREGRRFRSGVTLWKVSEPEPARYGEFPSGIDQRLRSVLSSSGIEQLYSHQSEAVEAILSGKHTVVVTPTATGKTLCYALPIAQRILDDPNSRALLLFPTKALARDQVTGIESLTAPLDKGISVLPFDGDTPQGKRSAIRAKAHVVVTNPDMLHAGILPHHTKWARFLQNLSFVVIDEIHHYRGVFGSHVANVIRRLKRICKFYGSNPVFIACSATIANPKEMAEAMVEERFHLISGNGAPRGKRHFIFYNPPLVDPELGIRRSVTKETSRIAARFIHEGIQTIVFGRSRLRVEILTKYLKRVMRRLHGSPDSVAGYRGGYLPAERRAIEKGIKSGGIAGVVGTNALELGIDIGSLGASILSGYPGTIASTWQQAGRAGRRSEAAAVVLVASSNPIDQYLINHPEYFFESSPERGIIHPDNLFIIMNHLKCSAFELPFDDGETFGKAVVDGALEYLGQEGLLRHTGGRWFWSSQDYPAAAISLRSATMDNFLVADAGEKNQVLAEVDRTAAPMTIHEGAIYIHQSRTYHVDRLDWQGRTAYVREVDSDYYTEAREKTDIRVLEVHDETPLENVTLDRFYELFNGAKDQRVIYLEEARASVESDVPENDGLADSSYCFGALNAVSLVDSFRKVRFETHENLGRGEVHLPEQELQTEGYWIGFGRWLTVVFRRLGLDLTIGIRGLGTVLRHVAPLFVMCDRMDLRVTPVAFALPSGRPTVYLYDCYPGGIGISRGVYDLHAEIIQAALRLVRECGCAHGCPSCVGPAREIGESGKEATEVLLRLLTQE